MSTRADRLRDAIRHGRAIRDTAIDAGDFDGHDWSGGVFERVRFIGVSMKRVRLDEAVFIDCLFRDVDMRQAGCARCTFDRCRLERVDLSASELRDCMMNGTHAAGVYFPVRGRAVCIA